MYLGLNLKYSETWAVIMSLYRVAEMETRGGRSHRVCVNTKLTQLLTSKTAPEAVGRILSC